MTAQKNCSVKSYNMQMAKYGKANCNIMYKCHKTKKNNKKSYPSLDRLTFFERKNLKYVMNKPILNIKTISTLLFEFCLDVLLFLFNQKSQDQQQQK